MYLTPNRIETQIQKADRVMRILWRLYSPHRKHRKRIVRASYKLMEVVEELEALLNDVKEDYKKENKNPLDKKSIPPGYHTEDNVIE